MCLATILFSGQNITPQTPLSKESRENGNNDSVEFHLKDDDNSALLDSLQIQNEKLVKEANSYVEIIDKNLGYIKNLDRKIKQKKEKDSILKLNQGKEIYLDLKICDRNKKFINLDCTKTITIDSIKLENYD
jgi:hypothetical protein